MSIVQMYLPIPSSSSRNLSSLRFLNDPEQQLNLVSKFSQLSFHKFVPNRGSTVIRMGGGPRTYPGGVSKWQWKRMQNKKQKRLLKARLLRERQIYEMRKRSELKAAVTELERPWEVVERAPTLFSVKADEQLKVLADRFRKPGGYDMWSEKDGPQVFHTVDGLPSTRFFPKGVVHSIKPYKSVKESVEDDDSSEAVRKLGLLSFDLGDGNDRELEKGSSNGSRRFKKSSNWVSKGWSDSEGVDEDEGFRSSRTQGSSRGGRRVGDVKRLGSANGREVFNGGRGEKGSSNGGLKRNGTRQNVEANSNWSSSGKANSDKEGRNEAPLERRGRYGSDAPRESIELRDSRPEEGIIDVNGRYWPSKIHEPNRRIRGTSKRPNFGNGRFGTTKRPIFGHRRFGPRSKPWRPIPPISNVSRSREVYNLSMIGGDSYGFQVTEQ